MVAYERPDGRYDVHTSRWGGLDTRLCEEITRGRPYAGGLVDPVPRVVARPFADVLTMVDVARHEAVYRVSVEYEIEAFASLWFGLDHFLGDVILTSQSEGLLVSVEDGTDARDLRDWFQAAKATVAEAVLGGYLDPSGARSVLEDAARWRAADRIVLEPGPAVDRNE